MPSQNGQFTMRSYPNIPRARASRPHPSPRVRLAILTAATVALTAIGCGSSPTPPPAAATSASSPMVMPGMTMVTGPDATGLTATSTSGYRFVPDTTTLTAGKPSQFRFQILGPGTKPVTDYDVEQTEPLHFYVIRDDLTGFQHVHPTLGPDGTWTAPLAASAPGVYRAYPQFTAHPAGGQSAPLVLGTQITVTGPAAPAHPLPAPTPTTQVDGYTLTLGGHAGAGTDGELSVTVSQDGRPVTDLQPYLDTYAHLTAFHQGDLAFAHLHPTGAVNGDHGGPQLSFHATLPEPGNYRMFLQFQTAGVLHTAAITLTTQ
ncbi:MAG: hypothetical protein ACRDS0_27095 [Pseudonocardiaceae bacterium]